MNALYICNASGDRKVFPFRAGEQPPHVLEEDAYTPERLPQGESPEQPVHLRYLGVRRWYLLGEV